MNRTMVLRSLQKEGEITRASLARMTGLGPATITNIINEFIAIRLVRENGSTSGYRGKAGIAISLDTSYYRVLGVRLTRNYFLVGLFDFAGNCLDVNYHKLEKGETAESVLFRVSSALLLFKERNKDKCMIAIGCAVPGPYLRGRRMQSSTSGEFPDWPSIGIQERLSQSVGLPVYLEHDANAGALAYHWKLGLETTQTLFYFSAGQGIGAGIVHEDQLLLGSIGAAGEVGHMSIHHDGLLCRCGNLGCLEMYCSSTALTKSIHSRLKEGSYSMLNQDCSFEDIRTAVMHGDRLATQEFERACNYLAIGVVNIVNLLNPDVIVVGDELAGVNPSAMKSSIISIASKRVNPIIWESTQLLVEPEVDDMDLKGGVILALESLMDDVVSLTDRLEKPMTPNETSDPK